MNDEEIPDPGIDFTADEEYDIGFAFGKYESYREAQSAFDKGEIELWLAYHKPKTPKGWAEWKAEHGSHDEFTSRWAK